MASRKSGKPASAKPAQSAAPKYLDIKRGVENWTQASEWLRVRGIEDIECITPDFAGVPRGKMMPSSKFTSNTSLALPSALFRQTISGEYPEETGDFRYDPHDGDLKLMPDLSTLSVVPWESDPTAQVICDMVGDRGQGPGQLHAARVLKKVVAAYDREGLEAGRRAGNRILPRGAQHRSGLSSCSRRWGARAGRSPAGRPIRSPASTSSTS
jgi:glutamine synthetase